MSDLDPKPNRGHGGRRPGAGRHRSDISDARAEAMKLAIDLASADFPELFAALRQRAVGLRVLRQDDKGAEFVYTQEPCYKSLTYLVDRVIGRPTQAVALDPDAVDVAAAARSTEAAGDAYEDPDDHPDGVPEPDLA